MTRQPAARVRMVDGAPCVVMPAGDDLLVLADALRWLNAWRIRAGQIPHLVSVDVEAACRFAAQIAVPPTELGISEPTSAALEWVSTTEAARVAGISTRGIRQRITRGQLPARRIGREWLVRIDDLRSAA